MSVKTKTTENKKGGDTTDTEISEKSKSKKRSEPSLDQINRRKSKIPLPSSKSDDLIPKTLVTAHEVTQDQDDMEKDDKVSCTFEGSKQR